MQLWAFPMKPVPATKDIIGHLSAGDYILEPKFDGHRALLVQLADGPTLWTRQRRPIAIPEGTTESLRQLGLPVGTVLDGEVWNPHQRGGWRNLPGAECRLTFWDAVRVGDRDLSGLPLEERKDALRRVLDVAPEGITVVPEMDVSEEVYLELEKQARETREGSEARSGFIHGIVLKRKGSPRRDHSARCTEHADWIKVLFPGMSGWEH